MGVYNHADGLVIKCVDGESCIVVGLTCKPRAQPTIARLYNGCSRLPYAWLNNLQMNPPFRLIRYYIVTYWTRRYKVTCKCAATLSTIRGFGIRQVLFYRSDMTSKVSIRVRSRSFSTAPSTLSLIPASNGTPSGSKPWEPAPIEIHSGLLTPCKLRIILCR